MTKQQAAYLINLMEDINNTISGMGHKCFICFGTLLEYIRHHTIDLSTGDIDIGIIGGEDQVVKAFDSRKGRFKRTGLVVDDVTKTPLKASYSIKFITDWSKETPEITVDLFFWKKVGGYYYHCFDENQQNPKDGVLSKYIFKGIEASCFDLDSSVALDYIKDINFGRGMNKNGTWNHMLQSELRPLFIPVPYQYGKCLDVWYPDWAISRNTGTSQAQKIQKVKSCADLR